MAMLIPSIDLMGGKIVQLAQGKKKMLEFDDFNYWIERFSKYPLVQLIDLDAAMGKGSNHQLVEAVCKRLPCQVGGGIRTVERAQELLNAGARRVIFGSALLNEGAINASFAERCEKSFGTVKLVFAIDSRGGKVATHGWTHATEIDPVAMITALDRYCGAFLYTHIDTEGTMTGFPLEVARRLREATGNQLIVAGGIRSLDEVNSLHALGVDAVVGMAIYTSAISN
jgi:phosphoribosylformimino-5-aminoimidazole carboxamide ribotide isomerase